MRESVHYKNMKMIQRARRVRARIAGTSARPRMSVHFSRNHLTVQFIDDQQGRTSLALADNVLESKSGHVKVAQAFELGKKAAEAALAKGITAVVFDRGARAYHGRVKSFADGAREGGLKF